MFFNRITYNLFVPWLTVIEHQTTRFLLLGAVTLGIAAFSLVLPKTERALEYAWCVSEEGALESALQHIAALRRQA
jgi:hypothetical protein